ncbi:hypothetical protein REPUB_Repub19eG0121000 [Reevesia pubescens]
MNDSRGLPVSSKLFPVHERDSRSYKDAFLGNHPPTSVHEDLKTQQGKIDDSRNSETPERLTPKGQTEKFSSETHPKEVNYELEFPKKDLDWLNYSLIGILKYDVSSRQLKVYLRSKGVYCKVRTIGGAPVILTFNSKQSLEYILKFNNDALDFGLDNFKLWSSCNGGKLIAYWVNLEEVMF